MATVEEWIAGQTVAGRQLPRRKVNSARVRHGHEPLPELNVTIPRLDHKQIPEKSRGLGDTVARFTAATGIKRAVDAVSKATGIPCGCGKRQDKLNQIFPYKTKENQ